MNTPQSPRIERLISVRGIVQGVGFRPAIWRMATHWQLRGYVQNDSAGVTIVCQGCEPAIDGFTTSLKENPPPAAKILSLHWTDAPATTDYADFTIAHSHHNTNARTGVSPDLNTCKDCLKELRDTNDRRYGYPFANCTQCGPRLSIIENLPYDRKSTTMRDFELCALCQAEYENPADRRYHAEPIACPSCGPDIFFQARPGTSQPARAAAAIHSATHMLKNGKILAVKGLGGFHLCCLASDEEAVNALRQRKCRPRKPLAMMARNTDIIARYCTLSDEEKELLQSAAAPIVLLRKRGDIELRGIAPQASHLGFMLPHSPLHHLLLDAFDEPLVMTSGNPQGQPQCITNDQAMAEISGFVDGFLMHNRAIANRVDDSVVGLVNGKTLPLRRARGYAPAPLPLPPGFENSPAILAMGGELKNTFCLLSGEQMMVSQHIGDLKNPRTLSEYRRTIELYKRLYQHGTELIAVDEHPDYLASQFGLSLAQQSSVNIVRVQHHHAHIAACLGEHLRARDAKPVLGVCLDGLGYSAADTDAPLWGGEFLLADYSSAKRVGRLRPVALPGGDLAASQPWRMLLSYLCEYDLWQQYAANAQLPNALALIKERGGDVLARAIAAGINAPMSSSCGRLFDAIAAACCYFDESISFEGEAAMRLQSLLCNRWQDAEPYSIAVCENTGLVELGTKTLWSQLLKDIELKKGAAHISARFHRALTDAIVKTTRILCARNRIDTVVLSGGVWQNSALFEATSAALHKAQVCVLSHRQLPANDGGIALGQALIASARHLNDTHYRGENPCA